MSFILFLEACVYDFLVLFVLLLSFNLAKVFLLSLDGITKEKFIDLLFRELELVIIF